VGVVCADHTGVPVLYASCLLDVSGGQGWLVLVRSGAGGTQLQERRQVLQEDQLYGISRA